MATLGRCCKVRCPPPADGRNSARLSMTPSETTGMVRYQRKLAEHVAWSEPGVTRVNDTLSIN